MAENYLNNRGDNLSEVQKAIRLEILQDSYWEHYKFEKDIAIVLPLHHPKRELLLKTTNEILNSINIIKNKQ